MSDSSHSTPAQELSGMTLHNGWKVLQRIPRSALTSGGHFSTSYLVKSSGGNLAFLKAMDYQQALTSPDPSTALQAITAAYNFERDLLEKCRNRHLSRVVQVIDSGKVPPVSGNPSSVIQYIIFELAKGDLRTVFPTARAFETALSLRALHNAAAALQQLHSIAVAHQDLKPSNVLLFDDGISKVADLGRAIDRNQISPHDTLNIAGDRTYAPPELLYGDIPVDWAARRFGCDMYLFGSLVVYFCTHGQAMTHLLLQELRNEHHPLHWGGTYREVLPYLEHHFASITKRLRKSVQKTFASDIVLAISQLCAPDPVNRGHPRSKQGTVEQYSLERYVSLFNRLARRAEYSMIHSSLALKTA